MLISTSLHEEVSWPSVSDYYLRRFLYVLPAVEVTILFISIAAVIVDQIKHLWQRLLRVMVAGIGATHSISIEAIFNSNSGG